MRMVRLLFVLAMVLIAAGALSQATPPKRLPSGRHTNAGSPVAPHLKVAGDLDRQLAQYKMIPMPLDNKRLSARERKLIDKLVEAAQYLEQIYWRQSDPEAVTLYQQLSGSGDVRDKKLRQLLFMNAGRFNLLEDNKPFVGADPMPPGRGFYPAGITREQLEQYVAEHPEKKAEIYSPYTVVRQQGEELYGIPYRIAYRSFLEPAAKALREAAALSPDTAFADFLRARAQALLSDDYYASVLKWLDLKDPKFDVIFAPYEVYDDGILGVK